jgi:hypothetical protein
MTDVPFTWAAVVGATSYVLQVGTGTGLSDFFNEDVGNVITYELALPQDTYYARVVPQGAGSTTAEQTFTISSDVYLTQYARPISDTAPGFWVPSTGVVLYEMVNEVNVMDSDYISSDATPNPDRVEFALTSLEVPVAGDVTIRIRGRAD